MDAWMWIVAATMVAVIVAIVLSTLSRRARRRRLQERFGPEYDRTIDAADTSRAAERVLHDREERHDALELHPLSDTAIERHQQDWSEVQRRFVDRPHVAVVAADDLVTQVMRERGYPVDNFDAQSELVSVDHPVVVENYRRAHAIYMRTVDGTASTEDLHVAAISYRDLFQELIQESADQRS